MSVFGHEDICRLDIAMHHSFPMRRPQPISNLNRQCQQSVKLHGATRDQPI